MDYSLFIKLDDALVYFYAGAFFFCLFIRGFDSATLSLVALVALEYFMSDVRDPLLSYAKHYSDYTNLIWYPYWILCYLLYIVFLSIIHRDNDYSHSKLYVMISHSFLAAMILQFIALLDALLFMSQIITVVYAYGVPAINISIFVYSLYYVVRYGSRRYLNNSNT